MIQSELPKLLASNLKTLKVCDLMLTSHAHESWLWCGLPERVSLIT